MKNRQKWEVKVAYRNANKHICINKYEFDMERAKKEMQVVCFECADDMVYRVVVEYENGDIEKDLVLKKLKTEQLYDQILFHTEKSLTYLKYAETEVIE